MSRRVVVGLIALLVAATALVGPATGAVDERGHAGATTPTGLDDRAVTLPTDGFAHHTDEAERPENSSRERRTRLPRVVAVYPNPVAPGDRGEFVVLDVPPAASLGELTLDDGEGRIRLPNRTATGRVVVGLGGEVPPLRPGAGPGAASRTTATVAPNATLSLANGGERVALRRNETTIHAVRYPRAPASELWRAGPAGRDDGAKRGASGTVPVDGTGWSWVPRGATDVAPATAADVPVRAFALPDAPGPPLAAIESATERLYLAGYTFSSRRATAALLAAHRRGVDVRVLLDGGPVGGVTRSQAAALDRLATAGVPVSVLDGPSERYRFHHAKYAVADDTAFVTSENWKASGTGGHGSRGWGVVANDSSVATSLAGLFRADDGWSASVPWTRYRTNETFREAGPPADETFPTRFRATSERATRVELLASPDNAGDRIRALLASAQRSILVQQADIARNQSFLRATLEAARRGVRVRVLLDGAWYAREENEALVEDLNALAAEEGLPLRAAVAEPRSRYSHVHVKGVVVDGERVLVGSINWNNVSVGENREVAVILTDRELGQYYQRLFRADWRGGAWRVTAGTVAVLLAAVALAGAWLRRQVAFAGRRRDRETVDRATERASPGVGAGPSDGQQARSGRR